MNQIGTLVKRLMLIGAVLASSLHAAPAVTAKASAAMNDAWNAKKMPSTFGASIATGPTYTCVNLNQNTPSTVELAWYDAWQTAIADVFAIYWETDSIRDTAPSFCSVKPVITGEINADTVNALFPARGATSTLIPTANSTLRLVFGGWGYTDNRFDISIKQAHRFADGPNFKRAGYGTASGTWVSGRNLAEAISCREQAAVGFGSNSMVTAYRMILDVRDKKSPKFSVSVKKPSEPYTAFREVLSNADYPVTNANAVFKDLSTTAPLKYFSFTMMTGFANEHYIRNVRILNPRFTDPTTDMPAGNFVNTCSPQFFKNNKLSDQNTNVVEFTVTPGQVPSELSNAMISFVPSSSDLAVGRDDEYPATNPNGPFSQCLTLSLGDIANGTHYFQNGWLGEKVALSSNAGNVFSSSSPMRIRIEMNQKANLLIIKTRPGAATDNNTISDGKGFTTIFDSSKNLDISIFDETAGKYQFFALYSAYGANTYSNIATAPITIKAPAASAEIEYNQALATSCGTVTVGAKIYCILDNLEKVMVHEGSSVSPFGTLPADAGDLISLSGNERDLYVCSSTGKVYSCPVSAPTFAQVTSMPNKKFVRVSAGALGTCYAIADDGTVYAVTTSGATLLGARSIKTVAATKSSPSVVYALNNQGILYKGTEDKGSYSFTAMPVVVGSEAINLSDISVFNQTSIMGITVDGKAVKLGGTAAAPTWSYVDAAGTPATPATGLKGVEVWGENKATFTSLDDDLFVLGRGPAPKDSSGPKSDSGPDAGGNSGGNGTKAKVPKTRAKSVKTRGNATAAKRSAPKKPAAKPATKSAPKSTPLGAPKTTA